MIEDKVVQVFREYRAAVMETSNNSSLQVAVDTLTMALLGGDVKLYRTYHAAALRNNNSSEQVAVDTLTMALMDRAERNKGSS